jgi:hypothetical protein
MMRAVGSRNEAKKWVFFSPKEVTPGRIGFGFQYVGYGRT